MAFFMDISWSRKDMEGNNAMNHKNNKRQKEEILWNK